MQCWSVYWFIMSFIKVLIYSEYAIEALKVTMSVCLSIGVYIISCCYQDFLMLLHSTLLMMLMLFMKHAIPINCNKTYEDAFCISTAVTSWKSESSNVSLVVFDKLLFILSKPLFLKNYHLRIKSPWRRLKTDNLVFIKIAMSTYTPESFKEAR